MKVLVVEDQPRIANYIKKGLSQKSMVVDLAYDGAEGYDFAASEDYDVIVLDIMLPVMDGIEVCKKLRAEDNKTPILMLTAKGSVDDKVSGLEAGADDYLPKPFAFAELIARIKALSRRPKDLKDTTLQVGDLTLDTNTYEVKRGEQIITLSKKEFSLLEFLMRHPGQIFSSDQLSEKVWSYDAAVTPNNAQVYIGYLRKKIDKSFKDKKPLIHTIRGFGYKISDNN